MLGMNTGISNITVRHMMKKRLSKDDWKLIAEALEMLSTDYPEEDGGHPEQERLDRLHEIAGQRAYAGQESADE